MTITSRNSGNFNRRKRLLAAALVFSSAIGLDGYGWAQTVNLPNTPPAATPVNTNPQQTNAAPVPPGAGIAGQPAAQAQTLTLNDVVTRALANNTGLIAAQQKLELAQELINQVNGQNKPQLRADANDTYSSFDTTAPSLPTLTVTNPTLPGTSGVQPIIDVGGNFPSTFSASPGGISGGGIAITPGIADTAPGAAMLGEQSSTSSATGTTASDARNSRNQQTAAKSNAYRSANAAPLRGVMPLGLILAPLVASAVPSAADSASVPEAAGRVAASLPASPVQADGAQPNALNGDAENAAASKTPDPQRSNYAARVSIVQYLDVFGLIPTARDVEKEAVDYYKLDIDRLQNETALAAKNLFFNALLAQADVATQQQQVDDAQQNMNVANSRFRNKIVSELDVLTAQTSLADAQQALLTAQNQSNLAQADLDFLLGLSPGEPLNLQEPILPPLNSSVDVAASTAVALKTRPEMRQANANIEQAEHIVKLDGAPLLPAFGVVASAEDADAASTSLPSSFANVQAVVAFPFDDGGVTRSRVRAAKVQVQSQILSKEELKYTIGLEVQKASYNIANAQGQVASTQASVAESEEAVRISQERYRNGLGTILDELNALSELATARTNLSVAEFLYQTSLAQLVRAEGGR